jgi:hypothetical protein
VQCQKKSLLINLLPLVVSYTWHNQTHNKKYYIIHNAVVGNGKGVTCNVLLLESLTIIIIAAAEEEGVNNDGIHKNGNRLERAAKKQSLTKLQPGGIMMVMMMSCC